MRRVRFQPWIPCVLALAAVLGVGACSKKPSGAKPSGDFLTVDAYCSSFCTKLCGTCGDDACATTCKPPCLHGRDPAMVMDGHDAKVALARTAKDLDQVASGRSPQDLSRDDDGQVHPSGLLHDRALTPPPHGSPRFFPGQASSAPDPPSSAPGRTSPVPDPPSSARCRTSSASAQASTFSSFSDSTLTRRSYLPISPSTGEDALACSFRGILPARNAARPARTASRIASAIRTGSFAPAIAVFISTPSQPSSIA